MSDCGVCLYSDASESCDFVSEKMVRARKVHVCSECNRTIPVGEKYARAVGKYEGEFWHCYTCAECDEIADAFYCDGRTFGGGMWDQMREHVFEA